MREVGFPASQQEKQDFDCNVELASEQNVHKGRHSGRTYHTCGVTCARSFNQEMDIGGITKMDGLQRVELGLILRK